MKLSVRFLLAAAVPVTTAVHADVNRTVAGVPITLSGYVDTYYIDDFADTSFPDRQITPSGASPDYSHSRRDKLGMNHALVDAKFATDCIRGALGVQAGTYVQKNYAAEDTVAQHLFEAQLGVRPAASTPLWIDAGIFASHIGLESAISKDNLTPTRSLMAENTPYYEAGAKLTWDPNARWEFAFLVLQGWQQIGSKNSNKAVGTQIQFKPADGVVLNSSTYVGQSPNARVRLRRYFHDFYATWQVTKAWSWAFTTDLGADERSPRDRALVGWCSATVLGKWQFDPHWAVAGRIEYYRDPHGLTISTGTRDNFVATGGSLNLDYQPNPHVLLRVEARTLATDHSVFVERHGLASANGYVTVSTSLSL